MKRKKQKPGFMILFMCCIALAAFLTTIPVSMADDHKGGGKHSVKPKDGRHDGVLGGLWARGHDEGNETTGQIVAWGLAAANLAVALSILLQGVRKVVPLRPAAQKALAGFNRTQKSYLMSLHYVVNPLILPIAILHWTLSRCKSTALPEWGLLIMGMMVALGIVLKFRLCPKEWLRSVYKLHTQPLFFLLLISMLLIGHLSMD